jgi:hypothetical protein
LNPTEAVPAPDHTKLWGELYDRCQRNMLESLSELEDMSHREETHPMGPFLAEQREWIDRENELQQRLQLNRKMMERYAAEMKALSAKMNQAVRWETSRGDVLVVTPKGEIW